MLFHVFSMQCCNTVCSYNKGHSALVIIFAGTGGNSRAYHNWKLNGSPGPAWIFSQVNLFCNTSRDILQKWCHIFKQMKFEQPATKMLLGFVTVFAMYQFYSHGCVKQALLHIGTFLPNMPDALIPLIWLHLHLCSDMQPKSLQDCIVMLQHKVDLPRPECDKVILHNQN